jgi:glycerophosphoryl diester phosphodiesterase
MRFSRHLRQLDGLFDRPIAHRGLHRSESGIIENTEPAFAAAIRGNYAIECDLQLTADGEAVVFHDETVDRLMDAQGHVSEMTVSELKSLNFKASKARIQTLAELLDQVSGQVPVIAEIKSHWDGNPQLPLRVVKATSSYRDQLALMSFDSRIVALLAHHAPNRVRGIVAGRVSDAEYASQPFPARIALHLLTHLQDSQPHFISYDQAGLPFAPVQSLRQAGMPVICWTIRSAAAASRALRYADQITFEGFQPA